MSYCARSSGVRVSSKAVASAAGPPPRMATLVLLMTLPLVPGARSGPSRCRPTEVLTGGGLLRLRRLKGKPPDRGLQPGQVDELDPPAPSLDDVLGRQGAHFAGHRLAVGADAVGKLGMGRRGAHLQASGRPRRHPQQLAMQPRLDVEGAELEDALGHGPDP